MIAVKKYRKLAYGGPWDGVPDNGVNGSGELSYTGTESGNSMPSQSNQGAVLGNSTGGSSFGSSIVDAGIMLGSAAIVSQAQKKRNPNSSYTPDGQNRTVEGAKGIATGWSIGNKIYPGIGGIVGAFAGGVYGAFKGNKMDKEAKIQRNFDGQLFREKERLAMSGREAESSGNINTQYYAYGGPLATSLYGNELTQTSSNTATVNGPSHEQGGVQVGNANLEGGESLTDNYVFSKRLGFAKLHKEISTAKGNIEKKAATPDRLNALKLLNQREQELIQAQEFIRSQYNLP